MDSYTSNPSIIMIAAAVIPAIYLMIAVYRLDRLEKEPVKLLLSLAVMGVLSTVLAEITEYIGIYLLGATSISNETIFNFILYFIIVAVSEEFFKYLLLKLKTWRSPHFNCQFDGVVYAVFVSLGFALWENIGYTIEYGISTALVRAITAIPGHTCFGVFMGVFYGAAKRMQNAGALKKSKELRILSVIIPVLLHGAYDFYAAGLSEGELIFVFFTLAMFIASYILIKRVAKNDRYIDNTIIQ